MGLFRLTRVPNLIILAITQYLVAIFLFEDKHLTNVLLDIKLLLLILSTNMIAAAGYIINDYYDTKVDYVNRPRKVVVGRIIDRRFVIAIHTALNVVAVFIGLYISSKIALVHFVSSFLLWLHSNQLKRLPLLGNLVIGILAGLSIWIISLYFQETNLIVLTYSLFAFFINLIREILKDLEGQKGESKFGSKALPSWLGIRRTKRLLFVVILAATSSLTIFLMTINNSVLTTYFVILVPIFGYFCYRLFKADTIERFAFLTNFANFILLTGLISITFF
ncbi:MAG: geranylgeranylglycerol-phosphate geranylgeranyltransferase [Cyclobacteriaceae bacterium]